MEDRAVWPGRWRRSFWRLFLAALLAIGACGSASAQQPASTPNTAAPAGGDAAASADAAISGFRSQFGTLRMLTYLSVIAAVAGGLLLYVYLRRRYRPFAFLQGAVCTVVLSLLLLWISTALALSGDSAACAAATLESGAQASDWDLGCRQAREHAANAFWVADAFRSMFMGADVAVAAGLLRGLSYVSVSLVALGLYLALRRPVLHLGVRA